MSASARVAIHSQPGAVTDRLAALDLDPSVLRRALWAARGEHNLLTANDPAWFAGGVLPAKATRYLRDQLLPHGWTSETDEGLELVVHPAQAFAIVVWSGDAFTADPDPVYQPSTRRPRGEASRFVVERNVQLDLFGVASIVAPVRKTWCLLVRPSTVGVLAELSLPLEVSKGGQITTWRERIILGDIDGRGDLVMHDITPAPKTPFDVTALAE